MGYNWNRFKGDFVSFNEIGDEIEGVLIDISDGTDFNRNTCPKLTFETDDGVKVWNVGQVYPQQVLAELQPEVGWRLRAVYDDDGEGRPGQNPAKLIEIEVLDKGEGDTKSKRRGRKPRSGSDL